MKKIALIIVCLIFILSSGMADSPSDNYRGGTVIDSIGREVKISPSIERIGCLYAFSAHVVTMLGRGEDIKAVVYGSKRDYLLNEINPFISDAGVPSDNGILNIEEILKLDLDLIFIKGETAQLDSEIDKLETFGLTYIVIDYTTIEEQMQAIEIIGRAINREDESIRYNLYYQNVIDSISEKVASLKEDERLRVFHSVNEASRTDAPGTIGAQWTAIAGAVNVSVESQLRLHDNKYYASLEQIYLWDPDVIIFNQEGVGEYMLTNEKWSGLRAIRDKKVYQIPVGISRWGHPGGMETPLAILWTAEKLYPDLFHINIKNELSQFYRDFFDFTVSEEMAEKILSGKGMRLPKGVVREEEN